jgi:outer membrane protein OmpA-like peptidoglycan-associated protein
MKKIFQLMLALLFMQQISTAQNSSSSSSASSSSSKKSSTTTSSSETISQNSNKNYIGLRGGILLKNNKVYNNPMWYIKNGNFIELNAGWRKGIFGWGAALGYLTLKRDVKQFETITLNKRMMYDSLTTGSRPIITSGLENNSISYGKQNHNVFEHKDLNSFYFLTGPDIWIGTKKLQLNAYAQGGLGYTQFGYYYVGGGGKNRDTAILGGINGVGAPTNYKMTGIDANYTQFGITDKHFNDVAAAGTFATKEKRQFNFMARVGASAEYFINPKISIHGGASYWYIGTPKMQGQQNSTGNITYTTTTGGSVTNVENYSYQDMYSKKTLGMVSVNAGIKFWMGGSKSSKKESTKIVTTEEVTQNENKNNANAGVSKNISIVVKDKCTGIVLPDVNVFIKQDGAKIATALTDANGNAIFENIKAGDLVFTGVKNEVATNSINLSKTDFNQPNVAVTLLHDDPRFTLVGAATNEETGAIIENVNVGITNLTTNNNKTVNSNSDGKFYQQLEPNNEFKIVGQKEGNFSSIKEVSTKNLERCKDLYVRLEMKMQKADVGKKMTMKNIFYDINKDDIRADAARELYIVVDFMNTNPTIRIELGSHTDSRSSTAYNLDLSQRRAQSAVNYLVSKGINRNRLVAKGYGESQLLNGCADGVNCPEAQHQENRRTEFKIIGN